MTSDDEVALKCLFVCMSASFLALVKFLTRTHYTRSREQLRRSTRQYFDGSATKVLLNS
jgi:hypothetical protein